MAHGWDSYFHDLPAASSDPQTLTRTSESKGSLPQHIEDITGHHDFLSSVAKCESRVPNSNFNTNCLSNPNIGNSSLDSVNQRYDKETPWQADGEVQKDNLPGCGNGDMDFTTDGLSTSESFPSSFVGDLQGIKQDCEMLATSFLEDYSDVSSCSEPDVGETSPSCKIMASNSLPKPKPCVSIKNSSTECLFTHTEKMTMSTERLCPNMSENNVILSVPSDKNTNENTIEHAKHKMESLENAVKYFTDYSQSSNATNIVTTPMSETVADGNDYDSCQHQKKEKENAEREIIQGEYSNISISGHGNVTGDVIENYPFDNDEEQTTATAPNMTIFDDEQGDFNQKLLRTEMKESFNQEKEGLDHPSSLYGQDEDMKGDKEDKCEVLKGEIQQSGSSEKENSDKRKSPNPNSTDVQDENMDEDRQDKSEVLKGEIKDSSSFENENSNMHKSSNPNSVDVQDENMETDCLEKEIQLNTSQSSDPGIETSNCEEAVLKLRETLSTMKSIRHDAESCVQLSERQSHESVAEDNICWSPSVKSNDLFSDASDYSDKNEGSVATQSESSLELNSFNTDVNACLEKELTSAVKKTDTASSPYPDCNGPDFSSDSLSIDTGDIKKQDIASHAESSLQPYSSSKDINPCVEKDITSLPEKKTVTSLSDPDCCVPVLTSDNEEQCGLQSCSQSKTSCTDIDPYLEMEWTGPAENTNTTSSPDQQQSLHRSPVALELKSLVEGVAENAMESFEGLDTPEEEPSVLGVPFGEPLSTGESSCDTDETKLDSSQYEDTSLARPDGKSIDHSGQEAQLESSIQMREYLQPVVLLKTFESVNGMDNYRCADCQHTTRHAYQLIEHFHCSHSLDNFQFCRTCNVYLVRNDQDEKHVCVVTKESPQPADDSSLQKKKLGRHRCRKCGVRFLKSYQYVKHMRTHTGKTPFKCKGCGLYFAQSGSLRRHRRIPGRCKLLKHQPVMKSDPVVSEIKTPPKNDLVKSESAKLPECYVKLVDISKTHRGKSFLNAGKSKKDFYNVHMGKRLAVSLSKSNLRLSDETNEKVENETRGKHKCPLCPRLFKYTYNRARHLRDCVKEKTFGGKDKVAGKYRCPLCHTTFTLASNRYRHINTFCLRVYVNQLAKQSAKSKQKTLLRENEQKQQELQAVTAPKIEPRYRCTLCPAVFWHPSGIYRHRKKHEKFKLTGKIIKYRNSISSTMSKPPTSSSPKTEESKDNSKSTELSTTPSLSCHFCGKCFSTSHSLKKHESNHKGERPYLCLECGKGFKRSSYLIAHKSVHQRRIQCTVCKKILPTITELIQHRRSHLKRGMLQCPDCHRQFPYPANLLRHLERHKKREIKALQLEERSQLKLQQSLETMQEDGGENQLQCSLCQEVFSDAQVLRKHCLTHISGPLSHQCPFCRQNLTNRKGLLRHMIKHTGDKPFSCTNCGKQFYRDIYLQHHRKQCLPAQTTQPVTRESDVKPKTKWSRHCSYCPRLFSKKGRLKNHHRGHKNNTLLLCSPCGQYHGPTKFKYHQKNCPGTEFKSGSSSLNDDNSESTTQTRQNVHEMAPPASATKTLQWKCPHCTEIFRYRSLLLRHVVSHTGVQPYPCAHCGQRYASRSSCMQHEASCDSVNKEGQSKVSGDAAKQLSDMPTLRVAAQKLQAAEAEFKCKFCTKTFMKARNLRRHILTHNEVKPYRCKACDNCFSRYDHLKVHQIRCKERRSRLEVCIPKISLDDVGKGWQNKFNFEPLSKKQETFECVVCSRSFPTQANLSRHNTLLHAAKLFKCASCGASFSHEKSLKHHRKVKRCRKVSKETNAPVQVGTIPPTEDVTKPPHGARNEILQKIQPHFSKRYKYMCSYCPRAFGNSHQLRVHIRLHTGDRPFACDYCDERFIRKDYVLRHLPKCTRNTQQKKMLCDRCGGFFPLVKLENHKRSCTTSSNPPKSTVDQSQQSSCKGPPKGFSCAYCTSRFLLFSQLQEHFINEHKMEIMAPAVSPVPLQHHLSNLPNIKQEPLDKSCDERPSDGANVICKLDTSLDGEVLKSYSCSECNMVFVNKAGLCGHRRVHSKTPFDCKTCKKGFWNKSLLRNHYRKCRPPSNSESNSTPKLEVPLKAEIDFALNDSVPEVTEGSKTTGTRVLQTNFSGKEDLSESPRESEENEMQKSKDKAVQYQCSECDQSFTDGLMLISHLEDHGREEQEKKRSTCSECGRVFSSHGVLKKHMRKHDINKKYSCPYCPEMFYNSSDLDAHTPCPSLNKPFACKLCNERFWTRPSLCNHYSEEHPDDVFNCRFCNKAYSVKKSLSRHYKKCHQQEQNDCGPVQEKRSAEKQSSSQLSTTESYEDDSEDSDSDSAPYFPCHVCGKTFPTSESLEDHQRCHLGEKPHECAECGRCFFHASQLQQHQRMHKSEFQCQACGRGFVSLFALRNHKHTHGKSRPYRCSKCDFSFTGPSQLAEHMSTHREENFPCDICNRVFLSKSSRAEHRKSHSKSGHRRSRSVSREEHQESDSLSEISSASNKELKYRCGVCSERFRDPEELSEHGCMEAKERPYSCLDCNKHFLHASHLKKHRTTHQLSCSERNYPCNQCKNSFSSPQLFLSHLKSHVYSTVEIKRETEDGDPSHSHTCPVCHQSFGDASELIKHFPTHRDSSFECKICKRTFFSEIKLAEHQCHQLTSASKYECTKCGQSFLRSNTFRQHNCFRQQLAGTVKEDANPLSETCSTQQGEEEDVDVTGEDLFFCPVCSMQFSSKSGLLEHQNKHLKEKPFRCELCGKSFSLRRSLKEHERRHGQNSTAQTTAHLAENKFKCTQCQTKFKTAQELSVHLRVHAEKDVGEFRCDMCYKSFSQWSLLKQHQESHVGQVVYECNECDKAFAFPHLLEEHQQTHAGSSQ